MYLYISNSNCRSIEKKFEAGFQDNSFDLVNGRVCPNSIDQSGDRFR